MEPFPSTPEVVLSAHDRPAAKRRFANFYLFSAVASLLIVLSGFSLTYILPVSTGTFSGGALLHFHGAMFFGWILLFIVQPALVHGHNVKMHRKVGVAGFVLAAGMLIIGVTVAITTARLKSPDLLVAGLNPKQFLIVPLTDMLLFAVFLGFSLASLKKPEAHKRLMLLSTISILPAAWGRLALMMGVANPLIFLLMQEAFLLAGIANDLITRRKVHPVYLWGGALLVLVHAARFPLAGSSWWATIAEWMTA
jgi:hypothetical protein